MGNWANDIFRGFAQGDMVANAFDKRVEDRKKSKTAETITTEARKKLFDVEDKGALGNWLWDKVGLGDPPQLINKAEALAPQTTPTPAPAAVEAPDIPIPVVSRAQPTPLVAVAQQAPGDLPESRVKRLIREQGVNV